MPTAVFRPLLDAAAALVGLPAWETPSGRFDSPVWLEALVLTESSGNPRAVRYEPAHDRPGRADAYEDADTPGRDDGPLEDDRSYGLLQVMGSNVRRLCGVLPGTPMNFGFALLPLTNLALGLRILTTELNNVHGDVARALARYNGGRTGDAWIAPGRMRRQSYVDRVCINAVLVEADRKRFS